MVSTDITGLDVGTYQAQITITDGVATNSPQTITVVLIINAPPPPDPITLTAQSGLTNIHLDWNSINEPSVTQYQILRAEGGSQSFISVAPVDNTAYQDNDPSLSAGNTYCYQVEALRADGNVVVTSNLACATFGTTLLWVPDIWSASGQTAIIPLNIKNATGLQVAASDIWLEFDGSVLEPLAVHVTP